MVRCNEYNSIPSLSNFINSYEKQMIREENFRETLSFVGSVKLHGANMSVCYSEKNGFYVQSRHNIISMEKDVLGFAEFAHKYRDQFMEIINHTQRRFRFDGAITTIIYGEWCGKDIQENVAISKLSNRFVIFDIKSISNHTERWIRVDTDSMIKFISKYNSYNIYNIYGFKTYAIDLTFFIVQGSYNYDERICDTTHSSKKSLIVDKGKYDCGLRGYDRDQIEKMQKYTNEVNDECPVAKSFGVSGIGEGIVWVSFDQETNQKRMFKTKGKSHLSKYKSVVETENPTFNTIEEFVDYTCTTMRLNQALQEAYVLDITSDYYKKKPSVLHSRHIASWLVSDIQKENFESLKKSKINTKKLFDFVNIKVEQYMKYKYKF